MREFDSYQRIVETLKRNILSLESASDTTEAMKLARKIQKGALQVEKYYLSTK